MPPKSTRKRKTDQGTNRGASAMFVWLLTYERSDKYDSENNIEQAIFSSREKAIAAMPAFMDNISMHGTNWRNGLEGFGRENEDDYLGYEYYGSRRNQGVLLSANDEESGANAPVEIRLKRMQVDPTIQVNTTRAEDTASDSDIIRM
jgi:hypothetical protein